MVGWAMRGGAVVAGSPEASPPADNLGEGGPRSGAHFRCAPVRSRGFAPPLLWAGGGPRSGAHFRCAPVRSRGFAPPLLWAGGGPRSGAHFRCAPVRSRASPYEKGQKQNFLCASTTKFCFCPFSHCSLLTWTLSHNDKFLSIGFLYKYMEFTAFSLLFTG